MGLNKIPSFQEVKDWANGKFTTLSEVNNNADVPNADYADSAGDADTLDGQHAGAFLGSSALNNHENDATAHHIPAPVPGVGSIRKWNKFALDNKNTGQNKIPYNEDRINYGSFTIDFTDKVYLRIKSRVYHDDSHPPKYDFRIGGHNNAVWHSFKSSAGYDKWTNETQTVYVGDMTGTKTIYYNARSTYNSGVWNGIDYVRYESPQTMADIV
ncbi:hypothetical protein HRTV-25_gp35 [Halorubrum tailed virus 25]|uniref:Uncharacterized protein n=1 Tax=Halorubrum tailed virus 25 TaxID=2878006 RepID=A0AAE9BZ30_9CAUD|nr:hypothetical protein M1M37_gp035 [Halorubrum tailed virus 25]UBF22616.1 hypothetical protein HRTV-25_gp35 [Halorubrum tailed virus 25]